MQQNSMNGGYKRVFYEGRKHRKPSRYEGITLEAAHMSFTRNSTNLCNI